MCESIVLNTLQNNEVPLIFGDHGTGKTIFVKKFMKKTTKLDYNHYLSCPLETNEISNIIHAVKNNPKQGIIIDNLESADSKCIKNVISLIKNKKKSTTIILICVNPYSDNIPSLKKYSVSIKFDLYNKITIKNFAKKRNASEYIFNLIDNNLNDLRIIKNMCLFKSENYDKHTYVALQNPFKGIEYLLGTKNNANLEYLINTNRDFYKFGILTNYCKTSNNISTIEKYSKYLSDMDSLNYESTDMQNTLLSNLHKLNKNQKQKYFRTAFPKFTITNKLNKSWLSIEHRDSILNIINTINNSKSVSSTQKEYINMIKNKYHLSFEFIEKQFKLFGSKKQKLKKHIKDAFKIN